jgi:hypothetical protein
MNRFSLSAAALAAMGASFAVLDGACNTHDVIAQPDASDTGDLDAGTGLCGSAACTPGQLCCAGADESCSPTCMTVDRCPAYGRPCKAPDGGTTDGGATLRWYQTCGDPVCHDPPDAGGPVDSGVCPALGSPCTQKGETCGDGANSCGSVLVCDDHDPKGGPGGCPISSAKFKDGIRYLNEAELRALHDETLATHLATYEYKARFGDPGVTHLGFIVEDQPQSLAVDRGHDRVDLYGYVSMVVATMQVQEKEIRALREEVRAAREGCAGARTSATR